MTDTLAVGLKGRVMLSAVASLLAAVASSPAKEPSPERNHMDAQNAFEAQLAQEWQPVWTDPGTGDWKTHWFLDGEFARVENTPAGMHFAAGPEEWNHAHHAVLWTRESFSGDLRIEYDYTRTDDRNQWVNILYIQATGTGDAPYVKDIEQWSEMRREPWMHHYFKHMQLLHVSYAAYGKEPTTYDDDYVRARRYPVMEDAEFGSSTDIPPDAFKTGLFKRDVTFHVTVIKQGDALYMQFKNADVSRLFAWNTSSFPPVSEGRIGLRHMWMRSARYANFSVSVPPPSH